MTETQTNQPEFRNEWAKILYTANIVDVCNALNIELTKIGRLYRGVEHDSLVITPRTNSFSWNSRNIGGRGGWSFVKDYVLDDHDNHLSKKDLTRQLREYAAILVGNNVSTFDQSEADTKIEPYVYPTNHIVNNIDMAKAYLSRERKIDPSIADWLHANGWLDQDKMDNAIFVERDLFDNRIIGSIKQGTHIDYQKYGKRGTSKITDKNSEPYAAWWFATGKPEHISFFESPIDAISYYQLLQSEGRSTDNHIFISMNGLKNNVVSKYVSLVNGLMNDKYNSEIKSITIAVDNDEAGRSFANSQEEYVFESTPGVKIPFNSDLPKGTDVKDWNDVLKKDTSRTNNNLEKDNVTSTPTAIQEKRTSKKDSSNTKDVVKTPIADLMHDVNQKLSDPGKTLELLLFLNQFRNYSFRNRMLIAKQRPGAIAVASFSKFKEMGYYVKKGEKGIKILVPVTSDTFLRNGKDTPVKYATATEKAKIKAKILPVKQKLYYVHGNVFDVSQTNMPKEHYPDLYPNRHLDFDVKKPIEKAKIDHNLDQFAKSIDFNINRNISSEQYSELFGNAKGVTVPDRKTIYLNPNNTPTEMTTTALHELGHAQLHSSPKGKQISEPIKELQAQLTSYLVASSIGIDNRDYTVRYIASWTDHGKKINELDSNTQAAIFSGVTRASDKLVNYLSTEKQQQDIEQTRSSKEQDFATKKNKTRTVLQNARTKDQGLEL